MFFYNSNDSLLWNNNRINQNLNSTIIYIHSNQMAACKKIKK